MSVELLTNAQINQIIKAGAYRAIDIVTGREFQICFGGARNDHYDVTPRTEADAKILESIIGQPDLRQWRARPIAVNIAGRWVAFGLCTFMHHVRIGGGNPGAKYPSVNESGPPWSFGGHECCYAMNSVGGAGNAPNAACSAEANRLAKELENGGRGGQARAACYDAYILGNKLSLPDAEPQKPPEAVSVSYVVYVNGTHLNVRTGPGTDNVSVGKVNKPQSFRIVAESLGAGANLWGQISADSNLHPNRWIALDYTIKDAMEPQPKPPNGDTYTVKAGDSLSVIARDLGVPMSELVRLNNIENPDRIQIGQVLKVPKN